MGKSGTIWSMIASVISPLLALLGVISCCGLPILAGILATLGIGASQLSFLQSIKVGLLALPSSPYSLAFIKFISKRNLWMWNECFRNKSEKTFQIKVFQKFFLWLGVAILVFVLFIGNKKSNSPKQ